MFSQKGERTFFTSEKIMSEIMNDASNELPNANDQNIFIEKNTETSHRSPSEVCDELPSER
jgi:hypothetical protein